jgi:D-arabinose 1-dehydrogenase-like Zn-dependent alcohol dehydrogenase
VKRSLEVAASGKIRASIDQVMSLREAASAYRLMEENQTLGKIILDPTLDGA